jgi:hypothetical protein
MTATTRRGNALHVIVPYRWEGTWAFDDERVGLSKEPFVCGIPGMIDRVVGEIPNAEAGFRLLFSASPFPGCTRKLTWLREEYEGSWYRSEELGAEGWLCPALLKYSEQAPAELYAKAEAVVR